MKEFWLEEKKMKEDRNAKKMEQMKEMLKENGNQPIEMINMRKMTMKMKKKKATTSKPAKPVKTGKYKEGGPIAEPKPFSKTKAPNPPKITLNEYRIGLRNNNIKMFSTINDMDLDFES